VRCAGEIQRAMGDRDLDLAEERRLRFRIGVNLGDVIADGGDIYGDGVNIAARLEGLAAPGSVCVSGAVRDHIGDRLPYAFEDMGEQSVKNIARPVRVYALRPEGIAGSPPANVSSTTSNPPPVAAPRLPIGVLPFTNLSDDRELNLSYRKLLFYDASATPASGRQDGSVSFISLSAARSVRSRRRQVSMSSMN
jgi:adenylate cyclase